MIRKFMSLPFILFVMACVPITPEPATLESPPRLNRPQHQAAIRIQEQCQYWHPKATPIVPT